jgi:hypothetical protein
VRHRYELSLDDLPAGDIAARVEQVIHRGFADLVGEGFDPAQAVVSARLVGARGEVLERVETPAGSDAPSAAAALCGAVALDADHRQGAELLAVELVVPIGGAEPTVRSHRPRSVSAFGKRDVWWGADRIATPLHRWEDLPLERWVDGPVLLTGSAGTHAIGPGWRVQIDRLGNALWESA